jgi:hypothetical protein
MAKHLSVAGLLVPISLWGRASGSLGWLDHNRQGQHRNGRPLQLGNAQSH